MRRILLFTLACLLGIWSVKAEDVPANIKDGLQVGVTEYVIDSPAGLVRLANIVNGTNGEDQNTLANHTFAMTEDIDLKDVADWTPIGTQSNPFEGTFDGNEKSISNLKISANNTNNYRGLFGYTGDDPAGATIKDLVLENVLIEGHSSNGTVVGVGALVGYSSCSTIENCHVLSGTIYESEAKEASIGGLIGYLHKGEVNLCSNNAEVISEVASVTSSIGGLIGCADKGTINCCFNQGKITTKGAESSQDVGGLIGLYFSSSDATTITNSYNIGNISVNANTKVYTGGIAGTSMGTIDKCYSYADITGGTSTESATGGIVGLSTNYIIKNCLAVSDNLAKENANTHFILGNYSGGYRLGYNYAWIKGANENEYKKFNGELWSGAMNSQPLANNNDTDDNWATGIWNIDATDILMPKLYGFPEGIVQPDIKNPTKASDTPSDIFHTITLEVAGDIDLYNMTAGALQIEEGGHLHLQFLPEATTATAADILFLVDGIETEFTSFGAGTYYSYILNPISGDHTILIAMKEYTVTLPELEGVEFNVGAGVHTVPYGEKFTFTLTLDDSIDPADVHVFANGIEVEPDALRATVLSYTIDKVITSIVVVIEGTGGTTGNTDIAGGKISVAIDNGQLTMDNGTANAVDVVVYSITGQHMMSLRGLRGSKTITLQPGVYIVRAGNQSWKVMVND